MTVTISSSRTARRARHALAPISAILLCSLLAIGSNTGGVWLDHLRYGEHYLHGETGPMVGYPMWGYSLLAGLFGLGLVFVQAALAVLLTVSWAHALRQARPHAFGREYVGILATILALPAFLLSTSYYSSSVFLILLYAAFLFLFLWARPGGRTGHLVGAALLLGLAYNVRTEALLIGGLTAALLLFAKAAGSTFAERVGRVLGFSVVVLALTIPWVLFTKSQTGQVLITSSNGGAVAYSGLGVLQDNPWGVIYDDGFVTEKAAAAGFDSPWSAEANAYFRAEFKDAVANNPAAFGRRILAGWENLAKQGVFLPNIRSGLLRTDEDAAIGDLYNEGLKARLGLQVNQLQLDGYRASGLSEADIRPVHRAAVLAEYGLRLLYLLAFWMLVLVAFVLVVRRRTDPMLRVIFIALGVYLLIVGGLVQTLPRHTTSLLPISLLIVLSWYPAGRPGSYPAP